MVKRGPEILMRGDENVHERVSNALSLTQPAKCCPIASCYFLLGRNYVVINIYCYKMYVFCIEFTIQYVSIFHICDFLNILGIYGMTLFEKLYSKDIDLCAYFVNVLI